LKSVVELGVWLSEGDVHHSEECLLDTLRAFKKGVRELLAGYRLEDGREESRV